MFHDTLKADVALLASLNIMDYSLLVSAESAVPAVPVLCLQYLYAVCCAVQCCNIMDYFLLVSTEYCAVQEVFMLLRMTSLCWFLCASKALFVPTVSVWLTICLSSDASCAGGYSRQEGQRDHAVVSAAPGQRRRALPAAEGELVVYLILSPNF